MSDIDYPNSYDSNCSSDYQEYLEESNNKNEVNDEASSQGVQLKNLKWIATLGVGGFGRVELVTLKSSDPDDQSFALKRMKKNDVSGLYKDLYKIILMFYIDKRYQATAAYSE